MTCTRSSWSGWRAGALAVALALAGGPAHGMTYRPISDENLVAASALVVVGEVERVVGARLADGRVVTQTTLRVGEVLKGRPAGERLLVTEPGGRVRGVRVRIPGVPEFAPGERALVFLRPRDDGTLGTTAFSLAKYTIAGSPPVARRTVPYREERSLAAFGSRIRSLAAASQPADPVADGFGGPRAIDVEVHVDGFTLLTDDPGGGDCDPATAVACEGSRWFEPRCGREIVYSLAGADATHGATVSRQAVEDALAAWTSAVGGRLQLVAGPDAPIVPSSLVPTTLADLDALNVVQFEDAFEVVPDLVACQGILAIGGTVSTPSISLVEGNTTFERALEGDVVVNDGAGACISATGLVETVAHEIGHTLGFGHSSENAAEPDPDLADALMYFLIHDDGRGAQLGTDDLAAVAFSYGVPPAEPTPVAEALRDVACLLDTDLWSSACFFDQDQLRGFPAAPLRKFAKAGRLAAKAYAAPKPKKQLKLLTRADKLLAKSQTKLDALEAKGTLRPQCAGPLVDSLTRDRERLAEARLLVEASL